MIQNELQETFFHGLTRQEVIDRIIEFELEHDILPDWREVLEWGWAGYQNVDWGVLEEVYLEYFTDEELEGDPDYVPADYIPMDGHGDHIPNDYEGDAQ